MEQWIPIYRQIEEEFSFSREREIKARNLISKLIGTNFLSVEALKEIIGTKVYVVGDSPNLEREIELISEPWPVIAADNAAVVLREHGIKADIIITDLDGDLPNLLKLDAVFGVHAHGDNIERLPNVKKLKDRFATTQIEPLWNVYNFGGFTDGDRAVHIAAHFGAEIHIVGFDFENPKPKLGKSKEIKRKKLAWAQKLISMLEAQGSKLVWESLK